MWGEREREDCSKEHTRLCSVETILFLWSDCSVHRKSEKRAIHLSFPPSSIILGLFGCLFTLKVFEQFSIVRKDISNWKQLFQSEISHEKGFPLFHFCLSRCFSLTLRKHRLFSEILVFWHLVFFSIYSYLSSCFHLPPNVKLCQVKLIQLCCHLSSFRCPGIPQGKEQKVSFDSVLLHKVVSGLHIRYANVSTYLSLCKRCFETMIYFFRVN